jgi:hypothetical protein
MQPRISGAANEEVMANVLVRRDQFNITPQGIVHKPTDAAFTPYPGDPYSGIARLGQLGSKPPNNGNGFRPEDVQRMMRELWTEYVTGNPQLFKAAELRRADLGAAGFNRPDANTN